MSWKQAVNEEGLAQDMMYLGFWNKSGFFSNWINTCMTFAQGLGTPIDS